MTPYHAVRARKDNDAVMLGDDAGGEDGGISGLEEDSEISVAEEKAEMSTLGNPIENRQERVGFQK